MAKTCVVITKQGLAKIAAATANQPLKLKKFAVGDAGGKALELKEDCSTSLQNEKYRDFINSVSSVDNNLLLECVLRANAPIDEGFTVRELGIFDEEDTLILIAKTPESYRPSNKEGVATESIYSLVIAVANSDNVSLSITEGVYATVDSLNQEINARAEALKKEVKARTDAYKDLDTKTNNNAKLIADLGNRVVVLENKQADFKPVLDSIDDLKKKLITT